MSDECIHGIRTGSECVDCAPLTWEKFHAVRYRRLATLVAPLRQIERGDRDAQGIAHRALVSAGLMEPDEFDGPAARHPMETKG